MIFPRTHRHKDKHSPPNRKKAVSSGKKRSLQGKGQMQNNHERSL